ncbi:S8 family serine peptidase [bacterium]|nr:S8 family serine peptidase [bacterium]
MKKSMLVVVALLIAVSGFAADKIRIEKLDDLPRHTYEVEGQAAEFVMDRDAILDLAKDVKKDLQTDLDTYLIEDPTTLKNYYADLGTIALIEKDWDTYLDYLQKRRELEDKEAARLTTGLFMESYITAVRSGDDIGPVLQRELSQRVSGLPYDVVGDVIKQTKGTSEIITVNLLKGSLEATVQPVIDGSDGEVSKDIATGLLGAYTTVHYYIPNKSIVTEVYSAYLDANATEKDDIWADRDIELPEGQDADPVVIGIWDSGVDADIFVRTGQMWTNENEVPDNGKDDDGNGFVDDVHGIAYDLHANKTPDLLYPIGDVEADRPRLQRLTKGLLDLQANIDSDEAQELRANISELEQSEVQPFIEDISKYGNYSHGTHVAGIASAGNPYIRLLACRLSFGHTMIPELPTIEQARKDSVMYQEVLQYFKDNNVRVVNMSWGESIAGIESALEQNNAGGTPEERKELARQIFEIRKQGLYDAIRNAPDILFVTSAGNSDNDVEFEEFLPSSFRLPNIISIGAVDQAGDETDFTSFGKVDVYANGFEVESYVPGGDRIPFSGTSMSSPNVVNLAAKLLVIKPDLTSQQLAGLILAGTDATYAGDRLVLLINPKRTFGMLMASMQQAG